MAILSSTSRGMRRRSRRMPQPKPKAAKPKRRRKRGRPRKGEARAKEPSRLERQADDEPSADAGGPAEGLRCIGKPSATPRAIRSAGSLVQAATSSTADGADPLMHHDLAIDALDSQGRVGLTGAGGSRTSTDLMDAAYDPSSAHCILLHKPIMRRARSKLQEALRREKKARRTSSVSSFPKSVATSSVQGPSGQWAPQG